MINMFFKQHRFLSNFYDSPVIGLDGVTYPTVEHAFQVAKTDDPNEREAIRNTSTPGQAKRLGRKVTLRSNWNGFRIEVMKTLVTRKFSSSSSLQTQLLATGDETLQEGNTWGDRFWGVDLSTGEGKNWLGQILMQVREELRVEV